MTVDFGDLEQQNGLPDGLLAAVQQQESGGDPDAVSSAGAIGAFQFMPSTAKQYGIDPTDPDQSAQGAAAMLGDLSKKYNGDLPSMLAAYNWGQGNVDRDGIENAPDETQNYIKSIQSKLAKPSQLGTGTQYAAADTGNMSDASVDAAPSNNVTLPDPSIMSADEIKAELAKMNGSSPQTLPDPSTMSVEQIKAELAQMQGGQQHGLIDALKNQSYDARRDNPREWQALQAIQANAIGEQPSAMLTGLKIAGAGAGAALDKVGEYVPQPVKNAASWAGNKVSSLIPQGVKSTAVDVASAHPEATRIADALGNIMGVEGLASWANSLAKDVGNAGQDIAANRLAAANAVQSAEGAIPAQAIKTASQNAYKYADNVGGILHPDFTNSMLDIMDNAKPEPLPGGLLTDTQKTLKNTLDQYSQMRDQPMTLSQFQNFDKDLTAEESAAMDGFKSTNNSRIIGQVQDQIRANLQKLARSDVIGGKEGFDALTQDAIPLWSTQTKMDDLETLINKANGTANPTQSTKSALNNLINSPKFDNYPPTVQDAIKQAAKRGSADDLLGILGSRLNPIIAGASGPAGMATEMATSSAARWGRNALQNSKNQKIMKAMTDPVRDSVKKFSTLPESPYPLKPESPIMPANPYINESAKELSSSPSNAEIGNLFNREPIMPANPEPQGTSSMYYAKGGIVKNREIHLTKQLTTKLGRSPSQRETELATYVGPHGVHRLLNQKDIKMAAHKMFPQEVVGRKRELFFNKKKPYTVEQIKAVL